MFKKPKFPNSDVFLKQKKASLFEYVTYCMCHYFEVLQYLLVINLNEFLPVRNGDGFKVVWNDISDDRGYRIDHSLIEHCRRNL